MISRGKFNVGLFLIMAVVTLVSLFKSDWNGFFFWMDIVLLFLLVVFWVVNYGINLFVSYFSRQNTYKDGCPYYAKEQCPYGSIEQCPYDTRKCYSFGEKKKGGTKVWGTVILLLFSLLVIVFSELVNAKPASDCIEWKRLMNFAIVLKILQPFANSIVAAILISCLLDIPGRMKEYQNYFIGLLSSIDYLKKMDENDLTKMRERITWLLHKKNYPYMPDGLVKIDEKVCEMLKKPYYKEYSQSMTVSKHDSDCENFVKLVNIEFIACNPHGKNSKKSMDIQLVNSVKFNETSTEKAPNEVMLKEAKELFKLKKYTVSIDSADRAYDLMPHINIGVSKEKEDGLLYNGKIMFVPKGQQLSNKKAPLDVMELNGNPKGSVEMEYQIVDESNKTGFYVTFEDKIKVNMQYEIKVPVDDICYTKRLRYPVKYFHLDYILNEQIKNFRLTGQLLGTLIDQNDIYIEISDDKKHVCMRTHNWLLPKNGAFIVHCKEGN